MLDEADRLLSLGFADELARALALLPDGVPAQIHSQSTARHHELRGLASMRRDDSPGETRAAFDRVLLGRPVSASPHLHRGHAERRPGGVALPVLV